MAVDIKYLREHYASLSDEALSAVDRTELVNEAQQCYDQEFSRRKQSRTAPEPSEGLDPDQADWLDEAAEIYSRSGQPGSAPANDVLDAEQALESAGIPCQLELIEEEINTAPAPTHRWRVLVPGNLNVHASSVLEREIFNVEFEAGWKMHLETLSDEELRAMTPQETLCGLFDRVERATKAYEEEIARRGR
jgi:hypothetical protein